MVLAVVGEADAGRLRATVGGALFGCVHGSVRALRGACVSQGVERNERARERVALAAALIMLGSWLAIPGCGMRESARKTHTQGAREACYSRPTLALHV